MLDKFEHYLYQKVFPQQPPRSIFHYTTQKGILGIIQTREMWATQVHFLNDKNEVFLTFKLIERELKKQIARVRSPEIKTVLQAIKRQLNVIDQGHICIGSFCEAGDLLSQWRGYGNQGKGYAIGFDLLELIKTAKEQHFVLWPCIYDPKVQIEMVEYLIDCWCEAFVKPGITEKEFAKIIDISVCQLAPIIKDQSFSEEQEWRLVSSIFTSKSPNFSFREGEFSLIPYYNFSIINQEGFHSIKQVVVGPSPHMELACNSLETFLVSQNLPDVAIKKSRIPFRNWK